MKLALATALLATLMTACATDAAQSVSRLSATDDCFTILQGAGDQAKPVGVTRQKVTATTVDGAPAWDVVVHQKVGERFDMRDHFVLQSSNLRPITLDTVLMGHDHAQLRYTATSVKGHKVGKDGQVTQIDVPLTESVWEGNLFGLAISAQPLAEGATFSVPKYQYDSGLGQFELKVTGSETMTTPEGAVEAWTVELRAMPEMKGRPPMTYQIAKSDHRELGYSSPMGGQKLGGDCGGLD